MTKDELFKQIATYLEEYFEISFEKITYDAKLFEELDLDSIDAVDLIVKLQELTKQKIAPADFKQVRTVGDVVEKVYSLTHAQ